MCGIAGVVTHGQAVDSAQLRRMAAMLVHRGPENIGIHRDGSVGIVHTRLSIIDLDYGDQPLFADGGRLALVANGEIYNYVELRELLRRRGYEFKTQSDCEVILHAYREYGLDFLAHIYGMFAFALYDQRQDRLVLARDRLGIKPLFLARLPEGYAFASELKAFLPLFRRTPEVDPVGLAQYLQNQFSSGPVTILKGVERILPAEAVCVEHGTVTKRWHYWSACEIETTHTDFEQAAERFEGLMETVMRQHMRSDVPFGLFLSGGVDSSILLALLSRFSDEPIRTFSVGFRESSSRDELPLAEDTAKRFSSRHTVLRPERDAMFRRLAISVWAADDLMRDYANLPTTLLAEEASRELKVVFSGEGGDEAFAGYGRYRMAAWERWVKGLVAPGSGGFRTRGTFRGAWPRRLFAPGLLAAAELARQPFVAAWRDTPSAWSDLQRMQYTDLTTALPDNLLVKLDRMLMAWGVEGRVPFLDHRVVEFALALPDHLKIGRRQGKLFLKQWASRLLPRELLFAHKRGFGVPVSAWFTQDFVSRLGRTLPEHPAIKTWFHPGAVRQLIERPGKTAVMVRMLWALLQFAIWYSLFIEGSGERPATMQDPLDVIT